MTKKTRAIFLLITGLLLMAAASWYAYSFRSQPPATPINFDGQRAYADVKTQVAFGSRVPGTEGHAKVEKWIGEELTKAGWQVDVQETEALGHPVHNIVAKRSDEPPQIVIGAHYDSRMFADNDPDPTQHTSPVPA